METLFLVLAVMTGVGAAFIDACASWSYLLETLGRPPGTPIKDRPYA